MESDFRNFRVISFEIPSNVHVLRYLRGKFDFGWRLARRRVLWVRHSCCSLLEENRIIFKFCDLDFLPPFDDSVAAAAEAIFGPTI